MKNNHVRIRHFPESLAGGFSRVDGTVQFFSRVQSLLSDGATVLEFGAGRGHELLEDPVDYRRDLRRLQARAGRVIGIDVDPVVKTNPFIDEAHVISPGQALPLADSSVDMIVSDHVFEHLDYPAATATELERVLKPGGWLCARTPNLFSYVGLGVNLLPNRVHTRLLRTLQPERQAVDVFPTRYRLNSFSALRRHFPDDCFVHASYSWDAEPVYVGGSMIMWSIMRLVHRLSPRPFRGVLFVFIQKKAGSSPA